MYKLSIRRAIRYDKQDMSVINYIYMWHFLLLLMTPINIYVSNNEFYVLQVHNVDNAAIVKNH